MVTGVTWQPYYDLHATTSDGKPSSDVSLHYCANITQNTGEDWTNTILTLSTANSHALHSLTVPKVDPLRLLPTRASGGGPFGGGGSVQQQQNAAFGQTTASFGQQQQQAVGSGASISGECCAASFANTLDLGLFGMARPLAPPAPPAPPAAPVMRKAVRQRSPAPGGWEESVSFAVEEDFEDIVESEADDDAGIELPEGSVLDKNPLSLAYRVEGKVSLPSDGIAHKVSIAVLGFSAALKYVCVPRKTTSAFIEGRIKNTSEYELLAGPVSVFMDDSFVTKTLLGVRGAFVFRHLPYSSCFLFH